jgi:aquaporin Z
MPRLERFTGIAVGFLVWTFITLEAPVSGMSMNPARTLASAVAAHDFTAFWVYLVAPPLGMALAAEGHLRLATTRGCAKLRHSLPCIFCGREPSPPPAH